MLGQLYHTKFTVRLCGHLVLLPDEIIPRFLAENMTGFPFLQFSNVLDNVTIRLLCDGL